MSFVFKINEELSVVPATAIELISIIRITNSLVKNPEFQTLLTRIVSEISESYAVVFDLMQPFLELDEESKFSHLFDQRLQIFKETYLYDISKPRRYSENVYDDYIALQQTKEFKSGFPLLKQTIARLDALYDKWITNDNLLAMCIDNGIKLYNRHLAYIVDTKKNDIEDAFLIHSYANDDFYDIVHLIKTKYQQLQILVGSASNTNAEFTSSTPATLQ